MSTTIKSFFVALVFAASLAVGVSSGPATSSAATAQRPSQVRTVIPTQSGRKIIVTNLRDAKEFKRRMSTPRLRRNFGWRVLIKFPYFRVACPIGIVSGVIVAVYRYRNGTGHWPTPGMVSSWTQGACG